MFNDQWWNAFHYPALSKIGNLMLNDKNIITENGRFYWYDEHGLERYGPYDTIREARDSMENYSIAREEAWDSEKRAKADQDAGCYDDPPYNGFYDIGGEG